MNGHIMLSNGTLFDLTDPDPRLIDIEVIADSLSKLCRFTGHTRRFYSVAEHCVLVSTLVPPRGDGHAGFAREGLLHDASEAFVGDMATPLKNIQPEYKVIEEGIERAIQLAFFGREWDPYVAEVVKKADRLALAYEVRSLMPGSELSANWIDEMPTLPAQAAPPWRLGWDPDHARSEFMRRYAAVL